MNQSPTIPIAGRAIITDLGTILAFYRMIDKQVPSRSRLVRSIASDFAKVIRHNHPDLTPTVEESLHALESASLDFNTEGQEFIDALILENREIESKGDLDEYL